MMGFAAVAGVLLVASSSAQTPDSVARRDTGAVQVVIPGLGDSVARVANATGPSTTPAAPKLHPDVKPVGTSVPAGSLRLVADVGASRLTLYQGDEVVRSYAISAGTSKYPTPRGSFRIRKIVWNPAWIPPDSKWARKETAKGPGERGNPMKVAKIFFKEPDYYLHGTGDTDRLGEPASHGCIRMAPGDVAELGQYVMEHGGSPRDESWFRRIFRFRSQTKVVYLDNPVPITVKS